MLTKSTFFQFFFLNKSNIMLTIENDLYVDLLVPMRFAM